MMAIPSEMPDCPKCGAKITPRESAKPTDTWDTDRWFKCSTCGQKLEYISATGSFDLD